MPKPTSKKTKKKSKLKQRQKIMRQVEQDLNLIMAGKVPSDRHLRKKQLLNLDEQEYLKEMEREECTTTDGPLVGILIGAVFTSFTGGLLLGALTLVSGLLQWWLTPQPEQRSSQRAEDPKFNPVYGGQIGRIAQGDSIPAIFTSVTNDPTGGIETGGLIIYGQIGTSNGSQFAKIRYIIGHGRMGKIDLLRTKVNDQPLAHYSSDTITVDAQLGTDTQTTPIGYDKYCQNVPVSNNNVIGTRLITEGITNTSAFFVDSTAALTVGATYTLAQNLFYQFTITAIDTTTNYVTVSPPANYSPGVNLVLTPLPGTVVALIVPGTPPATTSTIQVTATEFEGFGTAGLYVADTATSETFFRVTNKTRVVGANGVEIFTITTSPAIPNVGVTGIRSYQVGYYQTTRRVTETHLNFAAQIWARDATSALIDFVQMYELQMRQLNTATYTPLCRFYIRSKNPGNLYRSIELIDLPLAAYGVKITPINKIDASLPIYELSDGGAWNSYTTLNVAGTGTAIPTLRIQGTLTTKTPAELNDLASQLKARTPDNSPQRGSTLVIQNANEVEANGASGRSVNLGLPGLANVTVRINFNESISGQVNLSFFVAEGIITHKLLAAGSAGAASTGNTLSYLPGFTTPFAAGLTLRNASKRKSSAVTAIGTNTITTADALNWEQGDMWYLAGEHSTCWLPEIYSWLLQDPRFGASRRVIADYFLDWPVLVENTRWVEGINEHTQSFAWHGQISQEIDVAAWNSNNSKKVMLQPWQGRRKAYEPHRTPRNMPRPVIYNSSNARNFNLRYTTLGLDSVNAFVVSYRQKETIDTNEYALLINAQDVRADTHALAAGSQKPNMKTFDIPECTSLNQAKKTAQLLLQMARYSSRQALTLDAVDLESMDLRLGDALRVQTYATRYGAEQEGVVIETSANGFRISQSLKLAQGLSMAANPLGLTDYNADFVAAGVAIGDLVKNIETGATVAITSVAATTITCSPAIPNDTYYEILDMTPAGLVLAAPDETPRAFAVSLVAGKVWLQVAGTQPEVSDPIAIGAIQNYERFFQAVAIEPDLGQASEDGRRAYRIGITATNWTPKLFDFTDVRVLSRNGVDNTPP